MNTERCVKRLFPSLISGALVNESKTSTGTNSASTGTRHQQNQTKYRAQRTQLPKPRATIERARRGAGDEWPRLLSVVVGCCAVGLLACFLVCLWLPSHRGGTKEKKRLRREKRISLFVRSGFAFIVFFHSTFERYQYYRAFSLARPSRRILSKMAAANDAAVVAAVNQQHPADRGGDPLMHPQQSGAEVAILTPRDQNPISEIPSSITGSTAIPRREGTSTNACNSSTTPPPLPCQPSTSTSSPWSDNGQAMIDAALQDALREPRERMALLRLEAVLIDFVRSRRNDDDASSGGRWLEVGGPYNSVVIVGGSPATTAAAANPSPPPPPPTSFQRCLLHRLAQRFGLVRESGCVLEGSIRLVQVPGTKIPDRLLRDLEPHEYGAAVNNSNNNEDDGITPGGRPYGGGGGPPLNPWTAEVDQATQSLAQATLAVPSVGVSTATTSQAPQRSSARKMKIMKRSTTDHRSQSTGPNQTGGGGNGLTGAALKKSSSLVLSDKEKAYAEARARIFNTAVDESVSSSETTNAVAADGTGAASENDAAPAPFGGDSGGNSRSSLSSAAGVGARDCNSNPDQKAVYRNRLEEAADPDFRRGVVVVTPSSAAYASPLAPHHHPYYGVPPPYAAAVAASGTPPAAVPLHPYSGATIPTTTVAPLAGELSYAPRTSSSWTTATAPATTTTTTTSGPSINSRRTDRGSTAAPRLAADAPAFYPSWARRAPPPTGGR